MYTSCPTQQTRNISKSGNKKSKHAFTSSDVVVVFNSKTKNCEFKKK